MTTADTTQMMQVRTPIDKNGGEKIELIPLPPDILYEQADAPQPESKPMTEATARKASGSAPQAKLNFLSPAFKSVIPLRYPFEHPSTGLVEEITVRRLTVGDVGELLDTLDPEARDNFDIYAVMTGLPADVLRGLMDEDGAEVSQVCYDFLPPIFRPPAKEQSSTSPNGET